MLVYMAVVTSDEELPHMRSQSDGRSIVLQAVKLTRAHIAVCVCVACCSAMIAFTMLTPITSGDYM
jgi:hypothetical protein